MESNLIEYKKELEDEIKIGKSLERLRMNPDFILVIEQNYLNSYALRCLRESFKEGIGVISKESVKAQATVALHEWLSAVERNAKLAEDSLHKLNKLDSGEEV